MKVKTTLWRKDQPTGLPPPYHRLVRYYLKDAPAPEWITQGVTVLERERELNRSGKDAPATKDPGEAN